MLLMNFQKYSWVPRVAYASIIFSLLTLLSTGSKAQNGSPARAYADSSTLYVKKGTPILLYMGANAQGTKAVLLKNSTGKGDAIRWNGHGLAKLTHLNLYLGRNIRFDIFADGLSPKTQYDIAQGKGKLSGGTMYLSGSCVVELSSVDADAGVNNTYVSVNGSDFAPYSQPIALTQEGTYLVKFYSVDNVGNKEDTFTQTFVVDTTPPATELAVLGDRHNNVLSARALLSLSATDAVGVDKIYYTLNGAAQKVYSKPVSVMALPEGEYTILWHATDIVGNVAATDSFTFYVDRTAPMVFEEIVGNTYMVGGKEYSSGRSRLKVAAVDNKAGVKEVWFSINGAPFELYDKPVFLSDIAGAVNIRSYAIDMVGNKGNSNAEAQEFSMPSIDITGPIMSYSFSGLTQTLRDTLWISPQTRVAIRATDNGAGLSRIAYRVSGGEEQTYTQPFTIATAGAYEIKATAYDNVDNLNVLAFTFAVDAVAPTIYSHFSVEPIGYRMVDGASFPVFPAGVMLFLAATDNTVGLDQILVGINGAKPVVYKQALSGFKHSDTPVTIEAVAADNLGNASVKEIRFFVE